METIYAALLLNEAKQPINEENLKKIVEATGAQVDDAIIKATIASLKNVNIEEAIANASAATAAPAASSAAPEAKEEKKENKKEEDKKSSDEAVAGLGALFG